MNPSPLVMAVRLGGAVGVVGGGLALVVVVVAQVVGPGGDPLWPVSIAGWLSFILACVTAAGVGYHFIKNPSEQVAKSAEEKRAEMERRLLARLDMIDQTLARMSADTERRVEVWDRRVRVVEDKATIAKVEAEHLAGGMREVRELFNKQFEAAEKHSQSVLRMMTHIAGGVRGMTPRDLRDHGGS